MRKNSFYSFYLKNTHIFILSMFLFILMFLVIYEVFEYKRYKSVIYNHIIRNNETRNINNLEKVIQRIKENDKEFENEIKLQLKEEVNSAYNAMYALYNNFKGDEQKLINIIKEAIRPVRFNSGRGYFYIHDLDGVNVLYPPDPSKEGINEVIQMNKETVDYFDSKKQEALEKGESFFTNYWYHPQFKDNKFYKKIFYIKYFAPLKWIVGSGDYVKEIKNDLVGNLIKHVGIEGNIFFVLDSKGDLVYSKDLLFYNKNLINNIDKNGKFYIKEILTKSKNNDLEPIVFTVEKSQNSTELDDIKVYSIYDSHSNYTFVSGYYIKKVEDELLKNLIKYKSNIIKKYRSILMFFFALYIMGIYFLRLNGVRIKHNLNIFLKSMRGNVPIEINEKELNFSEFINIAKNFNKVIKQRNAVTQKLIENRERFEKEYGERDKEILEMNKKLQEEIFKQNIFQEEILESEERLKTLSNATFESIVIHMDGKIVDVNNVTKDMFGFERKEFLGKNVFDFLNPEDVPALQERVAKNITTPIEVDIKRKDGVPIIVELRSKQVVNGDKIIRIVALRDISKHKKIMAELVKAKEQAEKADRLKGEFLANISHEIRTPLTSIIGFSDVLRLNVKDENIKEYIDNISVSANHLKILINDILDVSRIEAGDVNIKYCVFDVSDLLHEIYLYFQTEYELNHDIEFNINMPEKGKIEINSDVLRIKQILINLILNAFKFTEKGSINVTYSYDETSGKLWFSVKDTGIGIDSGSIDKIFEKFTQLENTYTKKYEGIGVGLTICKSLVEKLGGNISVSSKSGAGSEFTFCIRNMDNNEREVIDKDREKIALEDIKKNNIKEARILIIDDHDSNVSLLTELLGCETDYIYSALSGKKGIEILKENKDIDIIVLDLQMPFMNGFECLKEIRKLEKEFSKKYKVIALTAHAGSDERAKCLEAGFDDYISKPFEIDELFKIISDLI